MVFVEDLILVFMNFQLSDFLSVDGIVKYMKGKAGPSSKQLLTVADAEKFLENNEHSIVGTSSVSSGLLIVINAQ